MLTGQSPYSIRQLIRIVHHNLSYEPPVCILPRLPLSETFLLVDGFWFKKWCVMMAYRRSKDLSILHISLAGRESGVQITHDLIRIKAMKLGIAGVVSDGGRGIVSAVNAVFPHTPHQICMAHMHREAVNALGHYPRDYRIRQLKRIADHVWLIESREALVWWQIQRDQWIDKNRLYLLEIRRDETGRWWYIHKGARKTVRILRKLPQTSFAFLTQPLMPKTTNEIEATFGHLGKRWLAHRGLKTERWENFMKWFVYFYNIHQLEKRPGVY